MKASTRIIAFLLAGWFIVGCSPAKPRFEAVARIGFNSETVNVKFEMAFLRAERFQSEVFDRLSDAELQSFGVDSPATLTEDARHQLFRHFVSQASVRRVDSSRLVEVCYFHTNADFAARIANKIAEVYLSVKANEAHLVDEAYPPKIPVKW